MSARPSFRALLAATGLAALAVAAAGPATAGATSAARRAVIDQCSGRGQMRPAGIVLSCADANWGLSHLRWKAWGTPATAATGTGYANTCKPNCASGHFVHFPVRVVAWRLSDGRYSRLVVRALRQPPAHLPRVAVFRLTPSGPSFVQPGSAPRPALQIGGGILASPSSKDAYLVNMTIAPTTGDLHGPTWVTACSGSVCHVVRGGGSLPIVNVPFTLGHTAAGTHVMIDVAACSAGFSCVRKQISGVVPKS